jgi:hypothetical protein
MRLVSSLYEGAVEVAAAKRSRRSHGAILLIDLDEAARLPIARRLGLAAKSEVEAELTRAGLPHGGAIRAVCLPGFVAYICHAADGGLVAVRYDVLGRSWLAPTTSADGVARLRAGPYSLRLRVAGETAQIAVDATNERGGFDFARSFIGRRRRLSAWTLVRMGLARRRTRGLAAPIAAAVEAWCAAGPCSEPRLAA